MAKNRRQLKPLTLSDQLRGIIERGPMTRYAISKACGVSESQLSKFIHGTCRLTNDSMDKIAAVLRLRLVQDDE